ncbi:hypothetical protein [Streptomyces sp. NPDC058657]
MSGQTRRLLEQVPWVPRPQVLSRPAVVHARVQEQELLTEAELESVLTV